MTTMFRRAQAADAARVGEVLQASRSTFLPFIPFARPNHEVRRWVRDVLVPSGHVTVAVVDGEIVGMMACACDEAITWVNQLYIYPSHVGQGIGSELLALAVADAPGAVRLYTFQQNLRAREFYEKRGFVAIEFTDGSGNEEKSPDVLYELAAKRGA